MSANQMENEKHQLWIDFDRRIPMRDGVTLSADVYRPKATTGNDRFPVILFRSPYNKVDPNVISTGRWFAERGYVVVWNDVRGRGDSDGEFFPYRSEGPDGYDAIEWCAAQDWCDGNVGTMGGSYLAVIQWLAALEQPPHLKTMISIVSPSDPFVEWPTGTSGLMHLCWYHLVSGRVKQNMDAVDWSKIYEHLPLLTMDEQAGRKSKFWRQNLAHPVLDDYWEPLCYQDKYEQIDLPVLHISGWYDDEQVGTPLNFAGMSRRAGSEFARQNQMMIVGPWGHQVNRNQQLGEVDFGPQAIIDLRAIQLAWFDRYLKGKENPALPEKAVRIFLMGANQWLDATEWPLAGTRWTSFYLHSDGCANSRFGDGSLSQQTPGDETPDRFHYDPARPVPFLTEPTSSQIGGPDDYAAIERRDDVLVYVTPPLEEELRVIGPVKLELYAASSAPDTDFMAKLVDVHPTGFRQRLCDGMVRARYRNGMDRVELLEPGQAYKFEIDLWNTAQVFKAGHRIGLEIASSAFPKYDRNLNTGEDLATGTRMQPADQTVYHDTVRASRLVLPVIPS